MLHHIPTTHLLQQLSKLSKNICIVGDKRLTIAYARHVLPAYTTSYTSSCYKWHQLVSFLEGTLKKHASIGAAIYIYHHKGDFIGTVKKTGHPLFVPFGVEKQTSAFEMPATFVVNPSQSEIDKVILDGWKAVETTLTDKFIKGLPPAKSVGRPKKPKEAKPDPKLVGRPRKRDTKAL